MDRRVCPVARRALLAGIGGAGIGALLAGCGGDPQPGAAGEATPGGTGTATITRQPDAGPETSAAPEPVEPDGALVPVEEVPVGGGVLTFGDILVVQPTKGSFRAYDAVCPHQSVIVDPPDSSGVITCPGHLSHFRASDGSRIDGQATRGLRRIEVRVVDGYVVRT